MSRGSTGGKSVFSRKVIFRNMYRCQEVSMKNWNLQNPLPGGFQTHLMTSASKNECPRTKFQPKLSQETSDLKFFVRKTCFETQFLVGTKINVFWTLMMIIRVGFGWYWNKFWSYWSTERFFFSEKKCLFEIYLRFC